MRNYVIIEASEVADVDFDQVIQNSAETLIYNADRTKTIVKFEGDTPSFLEGKTQYNHAGIKGIIEGPEWIDPDAEL
jgi:hypothetical protein